MQKYVHNFDHRDKDPLKVKDPKLSVGMHVSMSKERLYDIQRDIPGITDTVKRLMSGLERHRVVARLPERNADAENILLDFYQQPTTLMERRNNGKISSISAKEERNVLTSIPDDLSENIVPIR